MHQYVIVLDTNVCYMSSKRCDFTTYDFTQTVKNLISWIDELKLKDAVAISIPELTWRELIQHRIENYNNAFSEINKLIKNYNLPSIQIIHSNIDYQAYLEQAANVCKEGYEERKELFFNIPIPNGIQTVLINRAIEKKAPFEGIDSKSDKGFKDALLWESILDYKAKHRNQKIIVYTKDFKFDKSLQMEYNGKFEDDLLLFKEEKEIRDFLTGLTTDDTSLFSEETLMYSKLENFLYENENEVYEKYKNFMDAGAFGENFVVKSNNFKICQIVKKEQSGYQIYGDFYVEAQVHSTLESRFDKERQTFNPRIHLDIQYDKEHSKYKIELTGVT